jgi:hypothetical protein
MATKLVEICDRCKKEFMGEIRDVNHIKSSELTRFIVIGTEGPSTVHGFSIHTEVCKECSEFFLFALKQLFSHYGVQIDAAKNL